MPFAGSEYVARCVERDRLTDELENATAAYTHAVGDYTVRIGTMPEAAYRIARDSVELARVKAEQARIALLAHREEHGCG
jgi:hypothetical protein